MMVYLPRHFKSSSPKKSGNTRYLILLFLSFVAGFFYYSGNSLKNLFVSDPVLIIKQQDKSIFKKLIQGGLEHKKIEIFQKDTLSYLQENSNNAQLYYYLARSYYYRARVNGMKYSIEGIINIYANPNQNVYKTDKLVFSNLQKMWQNSLRANAIQPDFNEQITNQLMIYLYRAIEARKNMTVLSEQLNALPEEMIPQTMLSDYIWLKLLTTGLAGDSDGIKALFQKNESLPKSYRLQYSPQEFYYLSGASFFYSKDYINALSFLRKARTGKASITLEALKMESIIFREQNLPQKSLALLEKIHKQVGGQNHSLKQLWQDLKNRYPDLKSPVFEKSKQE